ncbi:MAG: efflux RND transporter permease subunit [Deltaproteobacteria bacterium]|nr:efflux RND transporter permease subunit [Deltaproteobacteria bacterium]
MKLPDLSIRRPVFAVMMIAALVVVGLFGYPRIGVDLFPSVEFPIVTVTLTYPGADPGSMETKVADPVEEALNTMAGIRVMRSTSLENVTQVIVEFELSVDGAQATQDVRDRVSSIMPSLPAGVEAPVIQQFDVGAAPIMSVAVAGDVPIQELTKLADDVVKERLQRIGGVGSMTLVGGREREIQVLIDPAKLAGRGLTSEDLRNAIQGQNLELPAGRISEGQRELTVKTLGEVASVEEIANIIIPNLTGVIVRVGDVAQVVDGAEEARSWSSMNGVPAVALVIRKQSGSNTVAVAEEVRAEVEALRGRLNDRGVDISIPSDTSTFVKRSIEDVKFDLLFGGLLAVLIIMFFLHDFRATLISAVAIPTSVVATFGFIDVMGFTFNNMTMLGLTLSIGILIDDAIVVIENIYRHRAMGKDAMTAASEGTGEIGLAVLATTATIIAVFIPVAFMKGIVGRFFYQFGLTVSFSVAVSTLVSLTLTPMLSSRLLKRQVGKPFLIFRPFTYFLDMLDRGYRWLLIRALRHRLITSAVAVASLVGAVMLVSKVEAEFVPPEDRSELMVNVELPTGSSLELTRDYVEALAADIRGSAPGVKGTYVTVGAGAQGQINLAQIHAQLVPGSERTFHQFDVMAWLRERYADIQDVKLTVVQVDAVGSEGGFRPHPVQFNIRGSDFDELEKTAGEMVARLQEIDGFVDLDTTYRTGKPELAVEIDREKAADLGVPVASIAQTIRSFLAGDKISELKDGVDIYDITMQLSDEDKSGFESLGNLKVRSASGQLVDLAAFVRIEESTGPSQIERQSRQRQVTILANLEDLPLGEATKAVDAVAADVVPDELDSDYAGMAEIMIESFLYMALALLLAIIFVYMVLAAQFNSFVHPFTIMLSLPLSVIGAFGALYISGMTLSIFSMIGVIMLMGIVTKNGILLVDYTNTLKARGYSTFDALVEAGPVRLRPILMTSAAMIFGMLPVAMAISEGGETRAPMAVCVIGGLITSTLLTLVVVPVVYSFMDDLVGSRPLKWLAGKILADDAGVLAEE